VSEALVYREYRFPRDLKYSERHAWVKPVGGGRVVVGVTDFAQRRLRAVVFVEPPTVGARVRRGDVLVTLESVKAVSELYSPVTGRVVRYNEALDEDPGLVNRDPYGEGWVAEIELEDPGELESLLSAEDYVERVVKREA